MNDLHLFDALKKVTLSSAEKVAMKSELLDFAERNPVQNVPAGRVHSGLIPSFLNYFLLRPMAMTLVLALILGGGVSVSAEHALPGDILYPIKTQVNERIIGLTALSAESRAAWDVKLVDRRVAEVEQLVAESRLDERAIQISEESLKRVTGRAKEHLKELETGDPEASARVDAEITASLTSYDQVLNTLEEGQASTTSSSLQGLHERVREGLYRAPDQEREVPVVSGPKDDGQKDEVKEDKTVAQDVVKEESVPSLKK